MTDETPTLATERMWVVNYGDTILHLTGKEHADLTDAATQAQWLFGPPPPGTEEHLRDLVATFVEREQAEQRSRDAEK